MKKILFVLLMAGYVFGLDDVPTLFSFTAGTPAKASEVTGNDDTLANVINRLNDSLENSYVRFTDLEDTTFNKVLADSGVFNVVTTDTANIDTSKVGRLEVDTAQIDTANITKIESDTANFAKLDVSEKATFEDSTVFSSGSQDYIITDNSIALAFQGQTAATNTEIDIFSATGDGTESASLVLWGLGTPGTITNREFVALGASSDGADITHFELYTAENGTGDSLPLKLYAAGNTSQCSLAVDGNVYFSGSINVTDTVFAGTYDFSDAEITAEKVVVDSMRADSSIQTSAFGFPTAPTTAVISGDTLYAASTYIKVLNEGYVALDTIQWVVPIPPLTNIGVPIIIIRSSVDAQNVFIKPLYVARGINMAGATGFLLDQPEDRFMFMGDTAPTGEWEELSRSNNLDEE